MGVYIFRSLHADYIKVGHHKITPSRPNVYFRTARRGFHSCIHPVQLDAHLGGEDFELLRWYPGLGRSDEAAAHQACSMSVGEFHAMSDVGRVIAVLDQRGNHEPVPETDRALALKWAGRDEEQKE